MEFRDLNIVIDEPKIYKDYYFIDSYNLGKMENT